MAQPRPQAIDWLSLPAMRPVAWWRDALQLWRPIPLRWAIACYVPALVEWPFQMLVPVAGVVVSKIFAMLFACGLCALMDDFTRNRRFAWRHLLWSFRPRNLPRAFALSVLLLVVLAADVLVAFVAYGSAGVDIVLFADFQPHKALMTQRFELVTLLPGMVVGSLFAFSPALVVLGGVSPLKAVTWSARWMALRPMALAITAGISLVLMAIALPRFWPLLVVVPWMSAMGYAAYVDVFGRDAPPAREGLPPKPLVLP